MRKELDGFDPKYRHSSDIRDANYNYPIDKQTAIDLAIDELNDALTWIWWIYPVDEEGYIVYGYTKKTVLELDDDSSPEEIEKAKKINSECFKSYGSYSTTSPRYINTKSQK